MSNITTGNLMKDIPIFRCRSEKTKASTTLKKTRGRSLYTTRMAESVSAQPKQTTTFGLSVIMMTISTWTPFTV